MNRPLASRVIAQHFALQRERARGQRPPPLLLLAGPQPLSPRWRDAVLIVASIVLGATVAFWLTVAR